MGDTGPGGGIVFYVAASNFTSTGSTCNTTCRYLEAAPNTWSGGSSDPTRSWSTGTTNQSTAVYQRVKVSPGQKVKKGDVFTSENLTCKRPSHGISPMEWDAVIGQVAKRDYAADEMVQID